MKVLLTGAAGFIGSHVARRLLDRGVEVVGIDNLNDYYSVRLKEMRLERLTSSGGFRFIRQDLADRPGIARLFSETRPSRVIHLGAQAGVRYSLTNPHSYADSNLVGFLNVLEGCRSISVQHLVFASSSSVYGANAAMPFGVHQGTDHPLSLYAASKKSNELMAHSYSHLYGMPVTGLRFFTVYGPWGRPDMALYLFAKAITAGRPIEVFNNGQMERDFTYIDDIVEGILRVSDLPAQANPAWDAMHPDPASSHAPYRIYNIGNNRPVRLLSLIGCLESFLGVKAQMRMLPMQAGDVPATFADIDDLVRDCGFRPDTPMEVGVERFVAWFREYHEQIG